MCTKDNQEFKNALKDIALNVHNLSSAFDRVRCIEWCKKLVSLPDEDLECSKLRNDYIQFLRIQVRNNFLHGPFVNDPPATCLGSFPEFLGNFMASKVEKLPRCGPIAPMLFQKSPDGRAYVSAKQVPGGGVLCYMAVSPDGLDFKK